MFGGKLFGGSVIDGQCCPCGGSLSCWLVADSKSALQQISEVDIAALTGLVKLYFRELPDGLLTDDIYRDIVKAMGLYHKSV